MPRLGRGLELSGADRPEPQLMVMQALDACLGPVDCIAPTVLGSAANPSDSEQCPGTGPDIVVDDAPRLCKTPGPARRITGPGSRTTGRAGPVPRLAEVNA